MKKTIYNVYVPMESQEQCARMKKVCVENGLAIWSNQIAFEIFNEYNDDCFSYEKDSEEFFVFAKTDAEDVLKEYTQVTESEFLELLKITKK